MILTPLCFTRLIKSSCVGIPAKVNQEITGILSFLGESTVSSPGLGAPGRATYQRWSSWNTNIQALNHQDLGPLGTCIPRSWNFKIQFLEQANPGRGTSRPRSWKTKTWDMEYKDLSPGTPKPVSWNTKA